MNPTAPPAHPPAVPPHAAVTVADGPPPASPERRLAARGPVFRAVLFKEARDMSKSLAGVACASGIATWIAFVAAKYVEAGRFNQQIALPDGYLRICTFLPPIAAVWLGLFQFFPEMRPARLGLLFHRPISRGTSFAAKFVAGVVLYMVAVGLPLLAGLVWASSPRHMFFPFTWSMAQIPLADILAGIPFYAAGALMALRVDARWIGSRIVPLAPAILCGGLNYVASNLGWSLLAIGITAALLGIAVAANFHPPGTFARQPRAAKAATAVMLIPSIALAGIVAIGLLMGLSEALYPPDYVSYARAFRDDGTPVIRVYGSATSGATQSLDIIDATGKVISSTSYAGGYPDSTLVAPDYLSVSSNDSRLFHEPSHYFSTLGVNGNINWYLAGKGDYIVGFDRGSQEIAGAIGPRGFATGAAVPPEGFAPLLRAMYVRGSYDLIGGDTIYRMVADHLVPQFTTPDHEPIRIGQLMSVSPDTITLTPPNGSPVVTALLTRSSVWFVSLSDTPARVLAHYQDANLDAKNVAVAYASRTRQFLVLTADAPSSPYQVDAPATLTYVSNDDAPARTITIVARLNAGFRVSHDPVQRFIVPAVTPPAVQLLEIPLAFSRSPDARIVLNTLFTSEATWISWAAAVLLAAGTFVIARYYAFPRGASLLWTLAVLALGPLGFLLLLSTRGLPRMVKCPHCGKPRPIDDAQCPHCKAEFPLPAADPAQIFA